jgi:very-short-patch-repair endonuclease
VAELAARQWGVVSRRQLRELGLGSSAIDRRRREQRLIRVDHGVYAVGHANLRVEGWWSAALLAGGEGSVLVRRAAGAAWDLVAPGDGRIDIAVAGGAGRGSRRVRPHRVVLAEQDVAEVRGLRVTSVARTLVDLGAVLSPTRLGEAVDRAITLQLYDQRAIDEVLVRSRGRPGAAALRADLRSRHPERELTESWLERTFLPMLDAAGLPRPMVNVWLAVLDNRVDLLWPDQRVVVELDGFKTHGRLGQFELDHEQTIELEDRGYVVRRFTHRQVTRRSAWVLDRLARALRRNAPR